MDFLLHPTYWPQQIVNGILIGGVYVLVALGFSIVWGILNIINLAHGVFIMLSAFITYFIWDATGLDPFLLLPVAAAILFVIGYATQAGLINFVMRAPLLVTLLLTFGIEIFVSNLALYKWKGDIRAVSPAYAGKSIEIGDTIIPVTKLGALGLAMVVTGLLALFMTRTKLGASIRATGMDLTAARLMGVNIARTYAITFALGAALAACAGVLISATQPFDPGIGSSYTIRAFVICVLGGLGSIPAVLVGGLLFGLIETIGSVVIGAGYKDAITFAVLVLFLVFRPNGLMGKEYYR
jgi:branched-chain amino acid transport system permease protein